MPHEMAKPFHEWSSGFSTAASLGPANLPCNGLSVVLPLTSWSYVRTTDSLLAMFGAESNCISVSDRFCGSVNSGSVNLGVFTMAIFVLSQISNKKPISKSATVSPR